MEGVTAGWGSVSKVGRPGGLRDGRLAYPVENWVSCFGGGDPLGETRYWRPIGGSGTKFGRLEGLGGGQWAFPLSICAPDFDEGDLQDLRH